MDAVTGLPAGRQSDKQPVLRAPRGLWLPASLPDAQDAGFLTQPGPPMRF
jgi:hypothetical protein